MIFVFLIVFGREVGNYLMNASWDKGNFFANILVFLCAASFSVVLFFLMFILWGGANDIEEEASREYIVGTFSSVVSFLALIVAIISLMR